jgi:small subunit ribosomal protein S1
MSTTTFEMPAIKAGLLVSGKVIKRGDYGILVDCSEGAFTGLILAKEVKNLERNGENLSIGSELEAEMLGPDVISDEWYYVISISKLKQKDILKMIINQKERDEAFTVIPTEANLGGLIVDLHGLTWFIPLSQLAPLHYPRVEDGDQEKIFELLLELLGKEIKVRIMHFDDDGRRVVLSEREALREEKEEIMKKMAVWAEFDGTVSGVSSYGFFVTIGGGLEGLVHISEITYGHVATIDKRWKVGDPMKVKIIGLEDGKISLSAKKLRPDPRSLIPEKFSVGDVIEWEVVRYVPYGVFIRVFDDINGLVHLSEISTKNYDNPAEALKLGQVVRAKIILMEPKYRKIGLSIKATFTDEQASTDDYSPEVKKAAPKKVVAEEVTE